MFEIVHYHLYEWTKQFFTKYNSNCKIFEAA